MPSPLFILAPPRSFTSVVGGMLGQHPDAYGLPEVNLSHGETLGDCFDAMPNALNYDTAGLLRLLAQLHDGKQTEATVMQARHWIMRRLHWPTKRVFAHIQEAVGDKVLVEKSPRNTMSLDSLRRLLRVFPDASFLHLLRHPRSTGKSTLDLMGLGDQTDTGTGIPGLDVDPEKIWLRAQTNITRFAQDTALGQVMRIKGEQLLGDPRFYLAQICDWAGLSSDDASIEAMLHPETSVYANIGPKGAPFGNDPNFLQSPALDFKRLAKIREPSLYDDLDWKPGAKFTKPTIRMARAFGYG